MRFADPQACPDCRGAINGDVRCPHCGLDLASTEVRQLWQILLQADALLASAPKISATPPPQMPPPAHVPPPYVPPAQPRPADPYAAYPATPLQQPMRPVAPPKERSWSVGTILLVLGAFGLIVAGLIFVTRSWEDIGLVGKTFVLLGVTAVIGVLGVWVTRRPLRASAEAVWTVFLALLTLDFFAARHEGMAGLGGVSIEWAWCAWGAVILGLGVLIALFARPHVKAELVSPSIAGALGITMSGVGAGGIAHDLDLSWRSIIALVVAGLLALAARPAKLAVTTIGSRVVVAGFYAFAFCAAFVEMVDNPGLDELVRDGHGLPMLLVAIASVVVAAVVRPVRIPAVALAVLAGSALVTTPASDARLPEGLFLAAAGLSAVLVVAAWRGTSDWVKGVRCGAIPAVGGIVLLHLGLLLDVFETIGRLVDHPWKGAWDARLDVASVENYPAWVVLAMLAALLLVGWFLPRWPELDDAFPHATSIFLTFIGVGVVDAVVAVRLPAWLGVAVLLAAASAFAAAHVRGLSRSAAPLAAAVVVAAGLLAVSHQGISAVAWLVGAFVLAVLARFEGPEPLRQVYAVGAVPLAVGGLAALVDLVDGPRAAVAIVILLASLGLVAAVGLLLRESALRIPLEAAAGIAVLVSLLVEGSTSELAVRWSIAGVAIIALSFVIADRRWYLVPGGIALVVAYVLLIVDSGFSFVEAYTLPLGAMALAAGLYAVRRSPTASTWLLLGPGLAISLLPSIPQALADPTDLRALLLGLGALVVMLLGIKLAWQAPFVVGVVVLALVVLFNIGPYANAAPRVVLIAVVSAALLGVGITWEDRVRDGRKLVGYVRSMR